MVCCWCIFQYVAFFRSRDASLQNTHDINTQIRSSKSSCTVIFKDKKSLWRDAFHWWGSITYIGSTPTRWQLRSWAGLKRASWCNAGHQWPVHFAGNPKIQPWKVQRHRWKNRLWFWHLETQKQTNCVPATADDVGCFFKVTSKIQPTTGSN